MTGLDKIIARTSGEQADMMQTAPTVSKEDHVGAIAGSIRAQHAWRRTRDRIGRQLVMPATQEHPPG